MHMAAFNCLLFLSLFSLLNPSVVFHMARMSGIVFCARSVNRWRVVWPPVDRIVRDGGPPRWTLPNLYCVLQPPTGVGIVTRLQAARPGDRDSVLGRGKGCFKSRRTLRPTWPPMQWMPRAVFPGLKQPGREADHSPLSSARLRIHGAIPLLPWRGGAN
jgi:hypothetical protein